MPIYMVSYDLNKAGKNYGDLIEAITEIAEGYMHHLESTWLIGYSGTAEEIARALVVHLDDDDELLVAVIGKDNAAWWGFNTEGSDWLMANLWS